MSLPTLGTGPTATSAVESATDGTAAPVDAVFAGLLAAMLTPHAPVPAPATPTSTPTLGQVADAVVATDDDAVTAEESATAADADIAQPAPPMNALVVGALALQAQMPQAATRVTPTPVPTNTVTPPTVSASATASTVASDEPVATTNAASTGSPFAAVSTPETTTAAVDASAAHAATTSTAIESQIPTAAADTALAASDERSTRDEASDEATPSVVSSDRQPEGPRTASAESAFAAFNASDTVTQPAPALAAAKGARNASGVKAVGVGAAATGSAQSADFATAARHLHQAPPATSNVMATTGAPHAAPVAAPPALDQILEAVAPLQHSGDGNYELTLELRPHDLGRVEITVHMRDGVLSMHMSADHAEARQLLRDHVEQLRGMLHSSGVATGSFDIAEHGQQQQHANAQALMEQLAQGRDEQTARRTRDMTSSGTRTRIQPVPEPSPITTVTSTRGTSTRVDVHA